MGRWWLGNSMLAQDVIHNKTAMTIELYEMWCSEIYDRDLTSVGRIHDAMNQRGGGAGAPEPPPHEKIIRNIGFLSNTDQDPLKN